VAADWQGCRYLRGLVRRAHHVHDGGGFDAGDLAQARGNLTGALAGVGQRVMVEMLWSFLFKQTRLAERALASNPLAGAPRSALQSSLFLEERGREGRFIRQVRPYAVPPAILPLAVAIIEAAPNASIPRGNRTQPAGFSADIRPNRRLFNVAHYRLLLAT
jgi:hypothetical protein